MTPITTFQGFSSEKISALIGDRDVFIWGTGPLGRDVYISLRGSGVHPRAFLDNRIHTQGHYFYGTSLINSDSIVNPLFNPERQFVVIASSGFKKMAEKLCDAAGLRKGLDYINYFSVSRPVAAVEISGKCNLKCLSCPRGNMTELLPEGLMSFEDYKCLLNKLKKDIPLLTRIELFSWGEPLLHPQLPRFIDLTQKIVPCSISTNLTVIDNLEEIIKAQPGEFHVTVNGFEDVYETMMPGAKWNRLIENLNILSELVHKYKPETHILIKAYRYKSDSSRKIQNFVAMGKKLNLRVEFCQPYLNPYDHLLSYAKKNKISDECRYVLSNLPWDIDHALSLAVKDKSRACLPQRIFPIINWNLSVSLCHVYYHPIIADNYLEIQWEKLLSRRHQAEHCLQCQRHGLHRLDIDILKNRYPKELDILIQNRGTINEKT